MTDAGSEVAKPLSHLNLNHGDSEAASESCDAAKTDKACAYCNKDNPTKRCAKRHSKCMPLMFCDKTCEKAWHDRKKALSKEAEETENRPSGAPIATAKKKAKKTSSKRGNSKSGEFWWN